MRLILCLFLMVGSLLSCQGQSSSSDGEATNNMSTVTKDFDRSGLDSAYFASGCFWCVESIYEHVKGVPEAVSGFAGGGKVDPSYREVASGQTNHAETVKVYYDPDQISFDELVEVYYGSQNPTTEGQDPDFGPQYRSIIFYQNKEEKRIAEALMADVADNYEEEVVTEIKKFEAFYPARAYHQEYEKKNPNKGYIQQVSKPRLKAFKQQFPKLIEEANPWEPKR